jgi:hypothetical protein
VTAPRAARGSAGTAGSHTWSLNVQPAPASRQAQRVADHNKAVAPQRPVCPPRQIMDGRSHTHCSRANLPAWHSLPAWQLRRSICTPRAGNCSAAPSSHPHVRNNHCSIWCRASRCTGSPRVHTCLFRVALPFRAPFRQLGNLGAQPFCGDATLGPEHLNGRCAFIFATVPFIDRRVNC